MATFNLTSDPGESTAILVETIDVDDLVILGRAETSDPANYRAIGFEPGDSVDISAFPELTAAQILASANNLGNGAVRFETPFFTLTLQGVTAGQLSEENFVLTNPPDAVADATTIAQGGTAVIPVLANDSDADGDSFSITGVTTPGNGTVAISGDSLVYNPAEATFSGVDSFNYTITDSTGETDTATVTVTVGGNLPPEAVGDTVEAIAAVPTTIAVLANDTDPDGDTLSIASVMNGANGTVSIVGSDVVYTPNEATFTGTDSFSYTITDGNGGTDWAQVNLTVVENQSPIANPDSTTIAVGATASIAVLENDSDPNGQTLMINGVSTPLNGTAVIDGDQIIYTPGTTPAGSAFTGVDTFFYTIGDGNGGTASSAVTVTIGGPQPPVAVDDSAGTPLGVPVTIDVLANDTDADGDTLSISGIPTTTAEGTLSLNGDQVVYTPNAGFNGTESFTYTVSDGTLEDTATVSVQVGGQLPPIASPDSATSENGGVVILSVLTNDSDPNGDTVSITGVGTPVNGTATFVGNDVVYTPPADTNFVGAVTFPYSITDGNGGTATADVTVLVDREFPPIANPDGATIDAGSTATVNVLVNDSDPDGDAITITGVSSPDNGETTFVGGEVIYIPNKADQTPDGEADFSGTDSFFYSITDGNGVTVSASVQVTVGGNQPPDAVDDATGTAVGSAVAIDVLGNDTDPEGNTITIFGTGSGANGSTAISNNQIVYTPNSPTFIGSDSFVYTISDGNGGVDTATVTVQVGELPPVATDDTQILTASSTQSQLINVLANDSDPDGGTFTLTDVGNGSRGVAIISNNQISYTPNADFAAQGGSDSFTYTITNDKERTDTATVTVLANQPPVANDDEVTIQTLGTATIAVLDNDTDADGDTLQLVQSAIDPGNGGQVVFNNGNIIYTAGVVSNPIQPFVGETTFTYSITDGNGGGDEATVTVNIGGMQPPVAVNDTVTVTAEGGAQSIDVLANDSDPDTDNGLLLLEQTIGQGANGAVVVSGNQAVYTPSSTTFAGTDSFVYTITDPQGGGQDSATATVIVQGNLPPLPQPDSGTLPVGGSTTIDVLANDSDPNPGDSLTVIGVTPTTTNGFTQLVENQVLFTTTVSDTTFEGTDTFTYTVRDSGGATATSTVTVSIGGNQPPVANPDEATVTNVSSVVIDVLTNDSDPNGDSLEVVGAGGATNGTGLRLSATQVLYTPATSTSATTDSFTYTVSDGRGGLDTATITVNINENGPPTAVPDTTTIPAGGTATIDVVANDVDPDGDSLQLVDGSVNPGELDNGGTLAIENGQVVYSTPNTNFVGSETFTYSVTDGFASAPGTVTVIVGGNQPPVANNDAVTTIAGGTTSISVLLNDSDPDANTNLSITGASTPANGGSVIISNNGTPDNPIDDRIVYISPSSTALTATDSFTYSISDQAGGVDSATVSVTINGNQAPTANDDAFTIAVRSTSTLDVLENDSDPNTGDSLQIIGAANASSLGSVTFTSERVIYTPNANLGENFTGTDSFTYTIADGAGVTATATGVVTLGGIQPPDAVRDTAGTSTGIATTINVLANDTDPSGTSANPIGTATISGFGNGSNGTVSQVNNQLVYSPNATFTGTDSFTYTVTGSATASDGSSLTDSALVTVTVSENQPPVANPDTLTIQLQTTSTLPVLDNDFDPNGEALSVIGAGGNNTSLGTVSVNNGQVVYIPNSGLNTPFADTDSFTYTIRDSAATGTSTATVTVTLGGNQPPIAGTDTATAIQAIPTTISVLTNDADPDASPGALSITGVSTPTNGTVTINDNGTTISSDDVVIYTSTNATFTGTDTFVYSVTDSDGTSGSTVSATVNVTVEANGGPTAVVDIATVLATGSSTIDVLSNDTDPNTGVGDILSVTGVGSQANSAAGSIALTNGQVIYTSAGSAATFTGTDSFTYTVSDLNGNTSTASVSVTVGGPQPPIANADSITIIQGSTATLSAALTSNDSDPNGDTFTIVGVSPTTSGGGTANVTGGQVIYNAPVAGSDTFTYSIGDADGTSSATVTVTLNASNAPIGVNDTVTTQTGTAATIAVLANDSDPDGDTLQLVANSVGTPLNGTAAINGNNVIYTPNTGFSGGIDQFTYSVTDGLGGTASATVSVTVGGPQPPDAVNDTVSVVQAITNTIVVLGNDTDPDGGTLSITGISTATNGTVAINNNGTATDSTDDVVLYTPTSTTFTGTDSFTYTITDGQGSTDSATVSVTVQQNESPTAVNDTTTILATGSATINVLGNDTDPNGASDTLSVINVGGQSNTGAGSVALTNGNVIYTSAGTSGTFTATDSFTYTIRDLSGNTSTASVSLTVGGPVPPVANDDSVTITQGTTQTLSAGLTSNDSDPNDDPFTIVGVTAPTNGGTASISAEQVVYTAPGTAGTDTFTYSIADATGTDAATVTVSVIAGSTLPVANNDYAIGIAGVTGTTSIPVLLNDSDPNGDTLSITGVTITGSGTPGTVATNDNGTPTISSDDLIVYTPPGTAPATDTITYSITDGNGGTSTGTVTVGVFTDAAGTTRSITGDANSNVLVGSDGTNNSESLIGSSGNDIFIGRGGIDILTGGAGNDIFRYESENDSTLSASDRIEDFATGDSIQIVADGFAATTPSASDLTFISTGSGFLLQIGNTNFALVMTTTLAQSDVSSAIAFI